MKHENKPTAYAFLVIALVLITAMMINVSCTANSISETNRDFVVIDKYLHTDQYGNEYYYIKTKQIVNDEINIEKLYLHQVSMYNIGDTIKLRL